MAVPLIHISRRWDKVLVIASLQLHRDPSRVSSCRYNGNRFVRAADKKQADTGAVDMSEAGTGAAY